MAGGLGAVLAFLLFLAPPAQAFGRVFAPCGGDCALAVYGGSYVQNSMEQVLLTDPEPPWLWDYRDDYLIGVALSRRVGTIFKRWDVEAEAGLAKRFGKQDEVEVWGAGFLRYRGFPWDRIVTTTVAVSTGLNYASAVSDIERERARDGRGDRLMHFFSPEITLALPSRPNRELLFRFHHRSGVFGLVSEAFGGAQYGAVGFRWRF